jgi:hypothetical protein
MTTELFASILSSSLLSAAISAIVVTRTKQQEYRNEYYKMVLQKRIAAYEEIQRLIVNFKTASMDEDGKFYHATFAVMGEELDSLHQLLLRISYVAVWISDDLFSVTREITVLLFEGTPEDKNWIDFGKKHYSQFSDIRSRLEEYYSRDMLRLYEIPKFLKNKKPLRGFSLINNSSTPQH